MLITDIDRAVEQFGVILTNDESFEVSLLGSTNWVRGTHPISTYEDRDSGLRVEFFARSESNLFCRVSSDRAELPDIDRSSIYRRVTREAPLWLTQRSNADPDSDFAMDVRLIGQGNRGFLTFRSKASDKLFLVIAGADSPGPVLISIGVGEFSSVYGSPDALIERSK